MKKISILSILHIVIIVVVYSTPFWLDWKLILLGFLLNLLQIFIFNGCILSQYQFKNKTQGFYKFYIDKYFPTNTINIIALNVFLDYILPIFLILIAYYIQNF